jgi:hypothetical protein
MVVALVVTLGTRAGDALASDVKVHGLMEVVASELSDAAGLNQLTRGDSPFDAYGLRLYVDGHAGATMQIFTQFVLRDATTPYVDGAYFMYTPSPAHDFHVIAGKIPWAIGSYAPRTYSNHNPLIGAPLMYQYHTSLVWYDLPPNADALLSSAGLGQFGANYEGYAMGKGMPIVDDSYWDVGFTVLGSARPLEYAIGMVAGTPGWGSTSQDENSGKSVLGRVGVAPLPGLRLGASASYGPYLSNVVRVDLPPGTNINQYNQQLVMADAELLVGHAELRAEAADNLWQSPTVGDLRVQSAYGELKYLLSFGAFLAGRLDALRFGDITDSTGARRPWDHDVTRGETGVGYRFNHDTVAKFVYQRTLIGPVKTPLETYEMMAAQVSITF